MLGLAKKFRYFNQILNVKQILICNKLKIFNYAYKILLYFIRYIKVYKPLLTAIFKRYYFITYNYFLKTTLSKRVFRKMLVALFKKY